VYDFSVIKTLRKKRSLSAENLAVQAGITRATIAKLEAGEGNPTVATLQAVAEALGLGASELLRLAESDSLRLPQVTTVRRAHYQGRRYRVGRLEFFRLSAQAEHVLRFDSAWHEDTGEVILLLEGRLRVRVGGHEQEMKRGDALGFKALQEHSLQVLEDSELVIIHHNLN